LRLFASAHCRAGGVLAQHHAWLVNISVLKVCASLTEQCRNILDIAFENRRVQAAVGLWRLYFETSHWQGRSSINRTTALGRLSLFGLPRRQSLHGFMHSSRS
jgi:hypothetical protein